MPAHPEAASRACRGRVLNGEKAKPLRADPNGNRAQRRAAKKLGLTPTPRKEEDGSCDS